MLFTKSSTGLFVAAVTVAACVNWTVSSPNGTQGNVGAQDVEPAAQAAMLSRIDAGPELTPVAKHRPAFAEVTTEGSVQDAADGSAYSGVEYEADVDYTSFIAQRLAEEGDDPEHGLAVTTALEESVLDILQEHAIEDAVLVNSHCGWSLCRFTLAFDSAESANKGSDIVVFGIPWAADGYYHLSEDDNRELVVYVAREGEVLPSPYY